MKKRIIAALSVLAFLLSFVWAGIITVCADDTLRASNVRVEITVNENNTYEITETIDIAFATPHHGIIRNIPLVNTIIREDGSTGRNYAEVSSINCNEKYSTEYENSYYVIRIGDEDILIEGHKQYVISYLYDIGNDTLTGMDELYLNVIGTEWTYAIDHLEVIIHMPKDFDYSKFGASHGGLGNIDYSGIVQKREGNTVFFEYDETLEPREAFTVRCELPEGYFIKKINTVNIAASVLSSLIGRVLLVFNRKNYKKHGEPDPVVETVEFYPPDNLTPPAMEYARSCYANDKSVNSLLLLLANKGFLTIDDSEEGNYTFTLYDKPTNELSGEEAMYFEGLWQRGHIQSYNTRTVTKEDLEDKFYETISDIRSYVTKTADTVYEPGQTKYAELSLVCGFIMIFVIPFIVAAGNSFRRFSWYHYLVMAFSALAGAYLIILSSIYHRRTQENNRLYGRIRGFENFLNVTEKDRLEMLVEENPMYFYDILPYAYTLGITDRWIKKFEGMTLQPVSWYHGNDFVYFMNHSMDYYSDSSSSSPHSDSDSGWSSSSDSGGGVSGGGSGGGGSSGW